jgi:hypothetical protein
LFALFVFCFSKNHINQQKTKHEKKPIKQKFQLSNKQTSK